MQRKSILIILLLVCLALVCCSFLAMFSYQLINTPVYIINQDTIQISEAEQNKIFINYNLIDVNEGNVRNVQHILIYKCEEELNFNSRNSLLTIDSELHTEFTTTLVVKCNEESNFDTINYQLKLAKLGNYHNVQLSFVK